MKNLVSAATICLVEPNSALVLVGRRRTPPWLGHWALPGGRVKRDETPYQTALRELQEESRITLGDSVLAAQLRHRSQGDQLYEIDTFIVLVPEILLAQATPELVPVWARLVDAASFIPMGPATRAVLLKAAEGIDSFRNRARQAVHREE